jgi:sodium-dependent dicarboxylate transporter 2/3/5
MFPAQVNPRAFMVAATMSTSFAFMLPIGTPPNAIVFATKQITILDMLTVRARARPRAR